jgi:Putative peptidoglycan binding domain
MHPISQRFRPYCVAIVATLFCTVGYPDAAFSQNLQRLLEDVVRGATTNTQKQHRPQSPESTGGQSCSQTAGPARAQELVRQCLQVSEATRPPCHADNPCSLIVDEIRRSCAMKRSSGIALPAACTQSTTGRATQPSRIDPELVREVQTILNALGYEAGPVDGLLGGDTRRAIQRFQRVNNLPPTGDPTPATTGALRQAYQGSQGNPGASGQAANRTKSKAGPGPVASAAGDRRQWIGAIYGNAAALVYGTPQSDDLVISFLCDRASKSVTVTFMSKPAGVRDGMRVDMELSSEGGSVALSSLGQLLPTGAFQLEATAESGAAIGRILSGGRNLSVRVRGSTVAIPLAGSEPHVVELVTACG